MPVPDADPHDRARSAATTRRVAFVDSGLGLVGYADALHSLRPDLGLVLSLDPDNMPYGPRTPERREATHPRLGARDAALEPDAIVVACNTASVHGLEALRAELEPDIPVIGTVPAIRPAAATGGPVAVWATAATTSSDYLRGSSTPSPPTSRPIPSQPWVSRRPSRPATSPRSTSASRMRFAHPRGRARSRARLHPLRPRDRRIVAALGSDVTVFDCPPPSRARPCAASASRRSPPRQGRCRGHSAERSSRRGPGLVAGLPRWHPAPGDLQRTHRGAVPQRGVDEEGHGGAGPPGP